ncbi:hypothetical protein BT96DRAFT_925797 [Gymnopus androsaceus JB14]|uniref:F-box domain-containing protein n=1 Tax=Gymnopus androsaceus JB14 TaxID=1447944 RepID=A0A6A4GXZ7_9AGAR|nr:hypothetical protein BT96DRAFT_925797 [Gymnopus androsaceus JB14]
MTQPVSIWLPPELQDMIIEMTLDINLNRSCLLSTSLVCSYWRQRTYERAFSSLCFSYRSIPAFASFLDNPFSRPAIFSRARRIRIIGSGETFRRNTGQVQSALTRLLQHLAKIGKISTLALDNLRWTVIDPAIVSCLTKFKTVESLSMHHIHFAEYSQFSDFVANFPSLRAFEFQNIECSGGNARWDGCQVQRELCTSDETGQCAVTLDGNGQMLVKQLTWMYSRYITQELRRSVSFYGAQTSYISNDVPGLLRSLGPLLTQLEIISPENPMDDPAIAFLDISANSLLQHLHLSSPNRVISMVSWLPSLLGKIKNCKLRTLHVSFAQSRQFHLDRPFLKHLGRILEGPSFQELELIEFTASSTRSGGIELEDAVKRTIMDCIRSSLPSWDRRGVLELVFH